jgi:hypothetical protein
MQQRRMVRLATVHTTFHARVIAARLGAEGMVIELRGNVDGIYPTGNVEVFVAEQDLEAARELMLADEVESAFDDGIDHGWLPAPAPWIYFVAVGLLAALALQFRSW